MLHLLVGFLIASLNKKLRQFGGVQSVSGGVAHTADGRSMLLYVGGQSGFTTRCVGPVGSTGVGVLRRDGVSAETVYAYRRHRASV